ncbi:MAG: hypothetical protein IJT98_01455 [Prevotella sp.]|nr:hypothetical protein [Prevotella sp.]
MTNEQKSWEKQFASFERDIDVHEGPVYPKDLPDFSFTEKDFDIPAVSNVDPKPEQPVDTPQPIPEPIVKEAPIEPVIIAREEPPRHEAEPFTAEGMEKLLDTLEKGVTAAIPLRDQTQRLIAEHDDLRLPKGLRTTAKMLCELTDVFIASKAVVSLFLELDVEPLYQSIEDCRLKSMAKSTVSKFTSHVPTMQEGLNDIEQAMAEGYDRPSANLRMRIVKAQAQMTQSLAMQQAQALAKVIETFPLENGSLRLLCLIKEKGDKDVMSSIDRTMELAEQVEVYVEYAPDMLAAVQRNDQKAVDAIVRKMLDNS